MARAWIAVALLTLGCSGATTNQPTPEARKPAPAGEGVAPPEQELESYVVATPHPGPTVSAPAAGAEASAALPPALAPTAVPTRGVKAIQDCLERGDARLELGPKEIYRAASAQQLARRLGYPSTSPKDSLAGFCKTERLEDFCAYHNCSAGGAALTWRAKRSAVSETATALLVLHDPHGTVRAYHVGELFISDSQFACGCDTGAEFTSVERKLVDVVKVSYAANYRPGRMCAQETRESTWLLDLAMRPVAVVVVNEVSRG